MEAETVEAETEAVGTKVAAMSPEDIVVDFCSLESSWGVPEATTLGKESAQSRG
jgi:hypothetical protein